MTQADTKWTEVCDALFALYRQSMDSDKNARDARLQASTATLQKAWQTFRAIRDDKCQAASAEYIDAMASLKAEFDARMDEISAAKKIAYTKLMADITNIEACYSEELEVIRQTVVSLWEMSKELDDIHLAKPTDLEQNKSLFAERLLVASSNNSAARIRTIKEREAVLAKAHVEYREFVTSLEQERKIAFEKLEEGRNALLPLARAAQPQLDLAREKLNADMLAAGTQNNERQLLIEQTFAARKAARQEAFRSLEEALMKFHTAVKVEDD